MDYIIQLYFTILLVQTIKCTEFVVQARFNIPLNSEHITHVSDRLFNQLLIKSIKPTTQNLKKKFSNNMNEKL